jgi:integrase
VLQDWVNGLAKSHAPNTVHNIFAVLRLVMAYAVRRRYIAVSPCEHVELPSKGSDGEPNALTDAEVRQLSGAMLDQQFLVAILVGAYCGPRAGELWALRKSDFAWRRTFDGTLIYELTIDEAIKEVTAKEPTPNDHERLTPSLLIGPTKTHQTRKLTVPEPIALKLNSIIDLDAAPDSFIFTDSDGGPTRHTNFYKRVFVPTARRVFPEQARAAEQQATREARLAGKAERTPKQLEAISPIRFHDLRHTCASIVIDEGRRQKHSRDIIAFDVMKYLGHKDIRTTFNIYAHWLEGAQEALAASLAARYLAAEQEPEPTVINLPLPLRAR